MKILIVNTVCGVGSTGRICTNIYEKLSKEGHECIIAYGRGTNAEKYKVIKIGNKLDQYFHLGITRIFDMHGLGSKRATKNFLKKVIQFNPDVIHLHNIHGYYLNYKILFDFLKEYKGKVIWTMHDSWAVSGHSATLDTINKKLPTKKINKSEKYEYPKTWFKMRWDKNYNDKKKYFTSVNNMTIVTPSVWLGKILKETFFSKYSFKVIHNGIDNAIMFKEPESVILKKEPKIVLGVANKWIEDKGICIFNELVNKLDNSEYKVILIGKKANISFDKKIKHIEYIDNKEELAQLYQSSYCFVNPTFFDNFPTVNIEALSAGLPIITFDTGGSKEIISEETGFICLEKTSDEILKYLSKVKDIDKQACIERGNSFTSEKMTDNYLSLYREDEVIGFHE